MGKVEAAHIPSIQRTQRCDNGPRRYKGVLLAIVNRRDSEWFVVTFSAIAVALPRFSFFSPRACTEHRSAAVVMVERTGSRASFDLFFSLLRIMVGNFCPLPVFFFFCYD